MSTTTALSASNTTALTELQQSSIEDATTSSTSTSTSATTFPIELSAIHGNDSLDDVASTSASQRQPSSSTPICRYFQRGICRLGWMCRFSHELAGSEIISSSTSSSNNCERPSTSRRNWANAPAFVPLAEQKLGVGEISYEATNEPHSTWADVVLGPNASRGRQNMALAVGMHEAASINEECPFECPCPFGMYCAYIIHMQLCEMCDQFCLHPSDVDQRKKHKKECLQQHEQAMELSFAIARSKDKTCGICFDTIMEKAGREKRFGILPNCNHIFCLECIRKWRQAKQFEHKITRSCPECRVSSDFVCPSAFWVETKEEKDKLLGDYRNALSIKDCKYFKKGDGKCPFGNKCFYKHALPNGDLVDVGLPKKSRKMHRSNNEIINLLDIYLYQFLEQRDMNFLDFFEINGDETDDDDVTSDDDY